MNQLSVFLTNESFQPASNIIDSKRKPSDSLSNVRKELPNVIKTLSAQITEKKLCDHCDFECVDCTNEYKEYFEPFGTPNIKLIALQCKNCQFIKYIAISGLDCVNISITYDREPVHDLGLNTIMSLKKFKYGLNQQVHKPIATINRIHTWENNIHSMARMDITIGVYCLKCCRSLKHYEISAVFIAKGGRNNNLRLLTEIDKLKQVERIVFNEFSQYELTNLESMHTEHLDAEYVNVKEPFKELLKLVLTSLPTVKLIYDFEYIEDKGEYMTFNMMLPNQ